MDHFTVVDLVTWPLNGSEAGVDLVLIQTSLLLLCKSSCSNANVTRLHLHGKGQAERSVSKQDHLSPTLLATKHTTVKLPINEASPGVGY